MDVDSTNQASLPPPTLPATQLLSWAWGRDGVRARPGSSWGTRRLGSRCLRTWPREVKKAGPCVSQGSKPLALAPKFHRTLFTKVKLSTISRQQQQNIKQSTGPFRTRGPGCLHRSQACDTNPTHVPPQGVSPATVSSVSARVLEKAAPAYKHAVNKSSETSKRTHNPQFRIQCHRLP